MIPNMKCARCDEWFVYEDTLCEDCGLDVTPFLEVAKSQNPTVSNYINRARWFWNAGIGLGFNYRHSKSGEFLTFAYAKCSEDLLAVHDLCYGSCYLYAKNKEAASISEECVRAAHMSAGLSFIRHGANTNTKPTGMEIQGVKLLNQEEFYMPENKRLEIILTTEVVPIN
ncbi:uncharacterized protein METZ01_LOCUS395006 [marine metagenome]|uniref:Uncharacterized protein n=1 Tax=marine metagenome TaxID=408172 RepID=A0A382V6M8_9ZZZZ